LASASPNGGISAISAEVRPVADVLADLVAEADAALNRLHGLR
jgi:hypothetical protein